MFTTSAGFRRRLEFAQVQLVKFSAPKLVDDTRLVAGKLPYIPLRAASATIGECLLAKSAGVC